MSLRAILGNQKGLWSNTCTLSEKPSTLNFAALSHVESFADFGRSIFGQRAVPILDAHPEMDLVWSRPSGKLAVITNSMVS